MRGEQKESLITAKFEQCLELGQWIEIRDMLILQALQGREGQPNLAVLIHLVCSKITHAATLSEWAKAIEDRNQWYLAAKLYTAAEMNCLRAGNYLPGLINCLNKLAKLPYGTELIGEALQEYNRELKSENFLQCASTSLAASREKWSCVIDLWTLYLASSIAISGDLVEMLKGFQAILKAEKNHYPLLYNLSRDLMVSAFEQLLEQPTNSEILPNLTSSRILFFFPPHKGKIHAVVYSRQDNSQNLNVCLNQTNWLTLEPSYRKTLSNKINLEEYWLDLTQHLQVSKGNSFITVAITPQNFNTMLVGKRNFKINIAEILDGIVQQYKAPLYYKLLDNNSDGENSGIYRAVNQVEYSELEEYDGVQFIEKVYDLILGKPADEAGISHFKYQLYENGYSKSAIIKEVVSSTEAKTHGIKVIGMNGEKTSQQSVELESLLQLEGSNSQFIENIYEKVLLKQADNAGLKHYLGLLEAGKTKLELIHAIRYCPAGEKAGVKICGLEKALAEEESKKRVTLKNLLEFEGSKFIEIVYEKILNREADDLGLATYLNQLKQGKMTKSDILKSLVESEEGQIVGIKIEGLEEEIAKQTKTRTITLASLMQYDGAEFIENLYLKVLGKKADREGLRYYLQELNHKGKLALVRRLRSEKEGQKYGVVIEGLEQREQEEVEADKNDRKVLVEK